MPEEIELKSYKVLKQLGWQDTTYGEGETVEMEPRFAEYYVNEEVLEETSAVTPEPAPNSAAPQALPLPSAIPTEAPGAS